MKQSAFADMIDANLDDFSFEFRCDSEEPFRFNHHYDFLNSDHEFGNLSNPLYPTLKQWMQLDTNTEVKAETMVNPHSILAVVLTQDEVSEITKSSNKFSSWNSQDNSCVKNNEGNLSKEGIQNEHVINSSKREFHSGGVFTDVCCTDGEKQCSPYNAQGPLMTTLATNEQENDNTNQQIVSGMVKVSRDNIMPDDSSITENSDDESKEIQHEDYVLLKDRKDVVNKTLLRAIRRFFSLKFRSDYPRKRYRLLESKAQHYKQCIEDLVRSIVEKAEESELLHDGFHLDTQALQYLIGEFVNPKMNKSMAQHYEIKLRTQDTKFLKKFISCCKSYSHNAFEEIIQTRIFKSLFIVFVANFEGEHREKISGVAKNDVTYTKAIQNITRTLF